MRIIIIMMLSLFWLNDVSASELKGRITSYQIEQATTTESIGKDGDQNQQQQNITGGRKKKKVIAKAENKMNGDKKEADKVVVLGAMYFPDHSLLRGDDPRIYVIEGKYKKHLKNLSELRKYAKQDIFNVPKEALSQYETRECFDGEIIREIGRTEVYYVRDGKANHVKTLEELKKKYRGQKINELEPKDMLKYFN